MLVLTIDIDRENLQIGDDTTMYFTRPTARKIRLAIDAPNDISIRRIQKHASFLKTENED